MQVNKETIDDCQTVWTVSDWQDQDGNALALYVEIIDMREIDDGPQFEHYGWAPCFAIVAAKPHPSYEGLIDAYHYAGGVPIDHFLLDADKACSNQITKRFSAEACKLHFQRDQKYGTLAAQRGKRNLIVYPSFTELVDAELWATNMINHYLPDIIKETPRILEMPINTAGFTGQKTIDTHVNGRD